MFMSGSKITEATDLKDVIGGGKRWQLLGWFVDLYYY